MGKNMGQLIFLTTVLFSGISFFSNLPPKDKLNPLYTYYSFLAEYVSRHWIFFLIILLVVTIICLRTRISRPLLQAAEVMILGFLFSSFFLFFIAFLELNIITFLYNIHPGSVGVITGQTTVIDKLKSYSTAPSILINNNSDKAAVLAVAVASAGNDNFYSNYLLGVLPGFLIIPVNQSDNHLLLVNRRLIINNNISTSDIETVSPYIGYLFVKQLFPGRNIKSYPTVSIMSGEAYQRFRQLDFSAKLQGLDNSLAQINLESASLSSSISITQDQISSLQNQIQNKYQTADSQYLKCLNIFDQSRCENDKKEQYDQISLIQKDLDNSNRTLQTQQRQLRDYRVYQLFYSQQKDVGRSLINNIPLERGAYDERQTIELNLDAVNPHTLADYFVTLIHEYLHYASYISPQKKLSSAFFEEGLTEYYARKSIADNFAISPNIGYPAIAKIVSKMAKSIPDSELADIYFNKDESLLESVLDRIYGKNFYRDNRIFLDALQYTSQPAQTIQLANIIMAKIGGSPLTPQDLYSQGSEFN